MEEIVYLNNQFMPKDKAKISIDDRGFLYGDGLFETMRVYNGKAFRLARHLSRLESSAELIGITLPLSLTQLAKNVDQVINRNHLEDAYLRITLSRGIGKKRLAAEENVEPTLIIVAREYTPYPSSFYQEGIKAVTVDIRRNQLSLVSNLKSLNYLESILARNEARTKQADEGILLNSSGYVSEAAAANIFVYDQEELITPPKDAGILPGITREAVIALAKDRDIPPKEQDLLPQDIYQSQECFLTNSLAEIIPVVILDKKVIGDGKPGPVTFQILKAYRQLVKEETQI